MAFCVDNSDTLPGAQLWVGCQILRHLRDLWLKGICGSWTARARARAAKAARAVAGGPLARWPGGLRLLVNAICVRLADCLNVPTSVCMSVSFVRFSRRISIEIDFVLCSLKFYVHKVDFDCPTMSLSMLFQLLVVVFVAVHVLIYSTSTSKSMSSNPPSQKKKEIKTKNNYISWFATKNFS